MKFLMLVYPGMTPLDMMGPLQAWSQIPEAEIEIVWKTTDPIPTDTGLSVVPTHTFETACENPDVLFVGGGTKPTMELMQDAETIQFLKDRGQHAKWITSVCTGALILGAAGLLDGYKATTHWAAVPMLEGLGATPTEGRYVIDRNRATGGGVTAGIDFGLALAAELVGEDAAKAIQLGMEYDPQPPFSCGSPQTASPEVLAAVMERLANESGAEVETT